MKEIERRRLKMESQDLEELKDDSINQFIADFDKEFGSVLKNEIKDTPLLVSVFRDFIEQNYKTSKYYKTILHKIVELEDELYASLTEEQKKLFKKWQIYRDNLEDDTLIQSFIYGYCLDKQLTSEKNNRK